MKLGQIRLLISLVISFFESNLNNPKVKKIALEVKAQIENLFPEDE